MGVLTWGQLRLNLQQTIPGVSLDLVDEALNNRYARVLDFTRWLALDATGYIETAAAYQSTTDTVAVTQGSTAITGTGTAWTNGLNSKKFQLTSDGAFYSFTYVSATTATLDRPYENASSTGNSYSLFTNVYPLPADFKEPVQASSADDGFPIDLITEDQLGNSVGFRDVIGEPCVGCVSISPTTLDGGTTWQVELFPIPQATKGYPIRYRRVAAAFTGANTAVTPLPFVSDAVLLSGARAELWARSDLEKAMFYEGQFDKELAVMVRGDRRKRALDVAKPPKRLTRHRLARYLRNSFPRIPN